MPDCSATMIKIGGTIATAEQFNELWTAIEQENVCAGDWAGDPLRYPIDLFAAIRAAAADGDRLRLYDNDQPWGKFEDIEAACQRLGLPYRRGDDGHYAYSAEQVAYVPAAKREIVCGGTLETGPAICLETLVRRLSSDGESALARMIEEYAAAFVIPPIAITAEAETAIRAAIRASISQEEPVT